MEVINLLIVNCKKSLPNAREPMYATKGAACFDLYTADVVKTEPNAVVYNTGWQFEIPQGHVMMLYSRSGHGFNKGIRLANGTGVIDSDYRGDVMVKLVSDTCDLCEFPQVGERIAQAMILHVPLVGFYMTAKLNPTERGEGGFGSTGA